MLFFLAMPLRAQNWTGNSSGFWNVASNWSSNPSLPPSSADTVLIFGPSGAGGASLSQTIPNPFLLNTLTFTDTAPAYTINGNALDFHDSSTAVGARINYSASNITLNTPLTLSNNLLVSGTGGGTLALKGAISGPGGLTVDTFSFISLGAANSFAGPITVNNGSLLVSNAAAIPTRRDITVNVNGRFGIAGVSHSASTAMGTLSVVGGYVQFTSGAPNFFLNRLDLLNAADGTPGTVNLSDVTAGSLHFVNPGAAINIGPGSNIGGSVGSRIVNDTPSTLDINIADGSISTTNMRLTAATSGH